MLMTPLVNQKQLKLKNKESNLYKIYETNSMKYKTVKLSYRLAK